MATRPVLRNLNATSVGIINTILAQQSGYLAGAPTVENTLQSVKQIGAWILGYQPRTEQFFNTLITQIAKVLIATKSYTNPWGWVKKGELELGEAIEEIYVAMAKPESYVPGNSTNELLADLFGKRKNNVAVSYHQLNLLKKFVVTTNRSQIEAAFNSTDALTRFLESLVQSLYNGLEYYTFLGYKALLYRLLCDGKIKCVTVSDPTASEANAKGLIKAIKKVSDEMTFLKKDYNMAGVLTKSDKSDQRTIITTDVSAVTDVDVLAQTFHMQKAEFEGIRTLIDSFTTVERDAIDEWFEMDVAHGEHFITDAEMSALQTVYFFILDKDFLMEYVKKLEVTSQFIASDLSAQTFLHYWGLLSASPFKSACAFSSTSSAISSVTVSPSTKTVLPGMDVVMTATVTATGFINQDVVWSIGDDATDTKTRIGADGVLHVGADETGDGSAEFTVIATSVADGTKYGSATITIGTLAT